MWPYVKDKPINRLILKALYARKKAPTEKNQ